MGVVLNSGELGHRDQTLASDYAWTRGLFFFLLRWPLQKALCLFGEVSENTKQSRVGGNLPSAPLKAYSCLPVSWSAQGQRLHVLAPIARQKPASLFKHHKTRRRAADPG